MGQLPGVLSGKVILLVICYLKGLYALQCLDSVKPCLNNATCVTFQNGTDYCRCAPGFSGEYCQCKDLCYVGYCLNGGECTVNVDSIPGSPRCVCPLGFTGQRCETDYVPCFPSPCLSGGTCQQITEAHYMFHCLPGWSGPDCSENIDDCAAEPCTAGSTCIDSVASFVCSCPPGKTGLLCHIDDACTSNPCKMGAQCDTNPVNGKFNCNCPSGYKGTTCAEDTDECVIGPNPCEHGGSCKNTIGSFTCNCPQGYTGPRCETSVNVIPTPARMTAPVLQFLQH